MFRTFIIMNITEKYNFKVKYDQFGNEVDEHFFDVNEHTIINEFEKCVLELKNLNKNLYTMIELGSDQAYYSLLFKAILGKDKTKNILLEPIKEHMERGKKHFEINEYDAIYFDNIIGTGFGLHDNTVNTHPSSFCGKTLSYDPITLQDIFNKTYIQNLDLFDPDLVQ